MIWRPAARRALHDITTYIADRHPDAARRLGVAIRHTTNRIIENPYIYRPGRVAGTREAVVHPNYILVYRVTGTIEILAVLHARQRYP
nr:type II toxin-antitoxin system RelE/ParE family toxin [Sphingomonas aerolata]